MRKKATLPAKKDSQKKILQLAPQVDTTLSAFEILRFLHDYQMLMGGKVSKTKLISLRVPENVLELFKSKAQAKGLSYQSEVVKLMIGWLSKP